MLIEKIGEPAMLEQLAEECVELAHAALKLARYLRGENFVHDHDTNQIYTGDDDVRDKLYSNLAEEMADVLICQDEITNFGTLPYEAVDSFYGMKMDRMVKRLGMSK